MSMRGATPERLLKRERIYERKAVLIVEFRRRRWNFIGNKIAIHNVVSTRLKRESAIHQAEAASVDSRHFFASNSNVRQSQSKFVSISNSLITHIMSKCCNFVSGSTCWPNVPGIIILIMQIFAISSNRKRFENPPRAAVFKGRVVCMRT